MSEEEGCGLGTLKKIIPWVLAAGAFGALSWLLAKTVTPGKLQALLEGLGPMAAVGSIGLFALLPAFFFPVAVLGSANLDKVADYIRSFGGWAMAFSFVLMVFSSLIAPLPAFMITLSNAAIFGWWQGALLSWSSVMVVINAILSGEIQLTQYAQLRELPVVAYDKLSDQEKAAFDAVDLGKGIVSQAELLSHRLPEMPAKLVPIIEQIWLNEVVGK